MKFAELISRNVEVVGSHFLLCNLISQRVKQLQDGAPPRVPVNTAMTKTEVALHEMMNGLVKYHRTPEE